MLTNGTFLGTFLRRARLVLRWATVSGFNSRSGHLFWYVTNRPPKANSVLHPFVVGKWVPASAEKAKVGMVHSVSGWTRGVQVKLWNPLRTRAIPERLRDVFTTRSYTNPRLPLPLPYDEDSSWLIPGRSRSSNVVQAETSLGLLSVLLLHVM